MEDTNRRDFALQIVLQRLTRLVPHVPHTVQEVFPFQAGIDFLDPVMLESARTEVASLDAYALSRL